MPFYQGDVSQVRLPYGVEGITDQRYRAEQCVDRNVIGDPAQREPRDPPVDRLPENPSGQDRPRHVAEARHQADYWIQSDA